MQINRESQIIHELRHFFFYFFVVPNHFQIIYGLYPNHNFLISINPIPTICLSLWNTIPLADAVWFHNCNEKRWHNKVKICQTELVRAVWFHICNEKRWHNKVKICQLELASTWLEAQKCIPSFCWNLETERVAHASLGVQLGSFRAPLTTEETRDFVHMRV